MNCIGPVAAIFWMDKELGSDIFLDGIVTVIDCKYGLEVCGKIHSSFIHFYLKIMCNTL